MRWSVWTECVPFIFQNKKQNHPSHIEASIPSVTVYRKKKPLQLIKVKQGQGVGTPRELVSRKMRKRYSYTHHPYAHTEEKLCEDKARKGRCWLNEFPYQKLALNLDSPLHWEEVKFLYIAKTSI